MTNQNYNNQILSFITDLDENISNKVVWDDGDDGEMTTFDFTNPITGSLDSHPIIYVPNFSEGRGYGKDQLEIADLDELYDFILIDEEE